MMGDSALKRIIIIRIYLFVLKDEQTGGFAVNSVIVLIIEKRIVCYSELVKLWQVRNKNKI
jgi:hypothetical protein